MWPIFIIRFRFQSYLWTHLWHPLRDSYLAPKGTHIFGTQENDTLLVPRSEHIFGTQKKTHFCCPGGANSIKRLKTDWQTTPTINNKFGRRSSDFGLTKKTRNSDSLTSEFHSGCKKRARDVILVFGAPCLFKTTSFFKFYKILCIK